MFEPLIFKQHLRVSLGKRVLTIGQLPAYRQLELIHYVAFYFERLKALTEKQVPTGYGGIYLECVKAVWMLVQNSCSRWVRWRVKREFFKKSMNDVWFLWDFINEIYNHWQFMGKWLALLAGGQSLQMAHGRGLTVSYMRKGYGKPKYNLSALKKLAKG